MSDQLPEAEIPPPDDNWPIPEDAKIDTPFPYLVGNCGPILMCAEIQKNRVVRITARDAISGGLVAEGGAALTLPPDGEDIGAHWAKVIQALCDNLLAKIKQEINKGKSDALAVPKKPGLWVPGAA